MIGLSIRFKVFSLHLCKQEKSASANEMFFSLFNRHPGLEFFFLYWMWTYFTIGYNQSAVKYNDIKSFRRSYVSFSNIDYWNYEYVFHQSARSFVLSISKLMMQKTVQSERHGSEERKKKENNISNW